MSAQTLKVLTALMSTQGREISGSEIAISTKLASGTLYPILFRLEKAGWLNSRWETDDPSQLGRPRRRYYQMTAVGAAKTRMSLREIHSAIGRRAWTW